MIFAYRFGRVYDLKPNVWEMGLDSINNEKVNVNFLIDRRFETL